MIRNFCLYVIKGEFKIVRFFKKENDKRKM